MSWHKNRVLRMHSRDSSVGRASDWRSEGPWFNPGSRHFQKSIKWNTSRIRYNHRVHGASYNAAMFSYTLHDFWKNWRIRVSIPVPLECKSSALPLELIPRKKFVFRKRCNDMNIYLFCGFHWWCGRNILQIRFRSISVDFGRIRTYFPK